MARSRPTCFHLCSPLSSLAKFSHPVVQQNSKSGVPELRWLCGQNCAVNEFRKLEAAIDDGHARSFFPEEIVRN